MSKSKRHLGVTRLGPGKYRIRATFVEPRTGVRKDAVRTLQAADAAEAARQRAALIETLTRPTIQRMRFAEFVADWSVRKGPSLKTKTARQYEAIIRLHLLPAFGRYWLDGIRPKDIVQWRDTQAGKPETINGRLNLLRNILNDAAAEFGGTSPASRVPGLRIDETEAKKKVMTPAELKALLEAAKHEPKHYPMILFLAHTGVRIGEASALRWECVDLEHGIATIRHSHDRGKLEDTKTGKVRNVPLSPELVDLLPKHRENLKAYQRAGLEAGWVFPGVRSGRPIHQSQLTKPLKRAAKRACLSWVPSPHCFRHTWNNILRQFSNGVVVRSIIGHSDESMTEHYSDVSIEERRLAQALALGALG